jgi:hypothetical protein
MDIPYHRRQILIRIDQNRPVPAPKQSPVLERGCTCNRIGDKNKSILRHDPDAATPLEDYHQDYYKKEFDPL